jgi:hypothetical protein
VPLAAPWRKWTRGRFRPIWTGANERTWTFWASKMRRPIGEALSDCFVNKTMSTRKSLLGDGFCCCETYVFIPWKSVQYLYRNCSGERKHVNAIWTIFFLKGGSRGSRWHNHLWTRGWRLTLKRGGGALEREKGKKQSFSYQDYWNNLLSNLEDLGVRLKHACKKHLEKMRKDYFY